MSAARPLVTLYVTAGCSLCVPFHEALVALAERLDFEVVKKDLLREEAGTRLRHRYDVPVVLASGEMLARHRLDAPAIRVIEAWRRGTGVA